MACRVSVAVLLASALALGGCSYTKNTLWPALGFQTQKSSELTPATQSPKAPPKVQANAQPAPQPAPEAEPVTPETSQFNAAAPAAAPLVIGGGAITVNGDSTGTAVGHRVAALQRELLKLRQDVSGQAARFQTLRQRVVQDSEQYHGLVAAITARLQIGTTPGNPIVEHQWGKAQTALDRLAADTASLGSLGNEVAGTSSNASYILQAVRSAFGISGAVDLDHQRLVELHDATEETQIGVNRLTRDVNTVVSRQSAYVGAERVNLAHLSTAIRNGQLYGASVSPFGASAVAAMPYALPQSSSLAGRQALMIIHFSRPGVRYQHELYNVMNAALKRRPQAKFDLVAVAMGRGSAAQIATHQSRARAHVDKVFRSLVGMGLPADRMTLSATTSRAVPSDEVRIYVR